MVKSAIETLRDAWWRISTLYTVRDEEAKLVPFIPRKEQAEFYANKHNRNFILKARKLGMSTLLAIDNLDACIFQPGMYAAIVDRSEAEACGKLDMARTAWENLGKHPDPRVSAIGNHIKANLKLVGDSDKEMSWNNGSKFEAGVSLRGGTPQRLHVSELGYIASHDRNRAQEIKAGSINAVPATGEVTIETTQEGGKVGISYEFARLAMDCTARGISSPLDWRFHFFPWFHHPSYRLDMERPRIEQNILEYFRKLQEEHGLKIGADRMAWYQAKHAEQREAMFREFPSTPDEAFRALVSGAIYPHMMNLRASGRIKAFEHDPKPPFMCAWDIGVSDSTSIWLLQVVGRELLWLAWHEGEGDGVGHYAEVIRAWEGIFGKRVACHFLPHDANQRERATGKTYVDHLREAGVAPHTIRVVPRCPDIWQGVNDLRDLLPRSWFHARCDEARVSKTGTEKLSGVGCLEAYHVQSVGASGIVRESPCHDESSHSADAARTFAEAWSRGMVEVGGMATNDERPSVRVISGLSDE
ncbi:MAG: hypothetical protein WCQ16_02880 [Verrucomicrobiae bacterium]